MLIVKNSYITPNVTSVMANIECVNIMIAWYLSEFYKHDFYGDVHLLLYFIYI